MLEARCESIGQHRHGIRFIDDDGRCLACCVETLRSDQSHLLEEVKELSTDKQTLTTCIEGLRAELAAVEAERDEAKRERNEELRRWQDQIRYCCIEGVERVSNENRRDIDGCGCDSGDPLDVTLAEIGLALASFDDELQSARAVVEGLVEAARISSKWNLHATVILGPALASAAAWLAGQKGYEHGPWCTQRSGSEDNKPFTHGPNCEDSRGMSSDTPTPPKGADHV